MASLTSIQIAIVDGATAVLNQIRNGTRAVQSSFTELNSALELVGKGFAVLSAGANFAEDLLQPARDVETALAAVQAVTGATAEEFDRLKAAAEKAGTTTVFSTAEAANGLAELARAGYSASDAIETLNPALNLAQGNNIKVSESAALLTTSLTQFGLAATQATRLADVLQKTADGTSTSVTEMGNALSYAAPGAKALGFSLEETSAAIGILANNGLRGERAGTVLRDVFTQLQLPTSQLSKLLLDAGVQTDTFAGFLNALGSDAALAEKAFTILGVSGTGLKPLFADSGKAVSDFTTVLQSAGGAAQATSDIMGKTFDSALKRLQNTFEQAQASFLQPLLAPLAAEFDLIREKINTFVQTDDFDRLKQVVLDFTETTIAQLNKIGADFDGEAAILSIKQFVVDVKLQFQDLADAASTVKTLLDGLSATANGVQTFGALVADGVGKAGVALGELDQKIQGATEGNQQLINTFTEISKSAREAADVQGLEYNAALERLDGIVGPATIALRELRKEQNEQANAALDAAGKTNQAADATNKLADANKNLAASTAPNVSLFGEIKGAISGVIDAAKESFKDLAPTLKANSDEVGKFGERVVTAVGVAGPEIEALRKKLLGLQTDLSAAFKAGDQNAVTAIGKEISATTAELEKLTGSAKPAGDAVAELGDKSEESAGKLSNLGGTTKIASDALDSIKESSAATAAGVGKLAGAVADASQRFVTGSVDLLEFGRAATKAGLYFEPLTATIDALGKARSRAGEIMLKTLKAELEALDPVQKRFEELRKQLPEASKDVLLQIQQTEEALARLKGAQQGAAGPNQSGAGGQGDTGQTRSSGGNFVINLSLSALDPKSLSQDTLKDFARQLSAPLRNFAQSGS